MPNRSITLFLFILKLIAIGVSQLGIRLCKVILVHLTTKRYVCKSTVNNKEILVHLTINRNMNNNHLEWVNLPVLVERNRLSVGKQGGGIVWGACLQSSKS